MLFRVGAGACCDVGGHSPAGPLHGTRSVQVSTRQLLSILSQIFQYSVMFPTYLYLVFPHKFHFGYRQEFNLLLKVIVPLMDFKSVLLL